MLCQVCTAHNDDDADYCGRCQHKLLVLSGAAVDAAEAFEPGEEEAFSLEEHLLERISILEEVLKRTGETVQQILTALERHEHNVLVNHVGLMTLQETLDEQGVVGAEEWGGRWERRIERHLSALEKRELFNESSTRIRALFRGGDLAGFEERVDEAKGALVRFEIGRGFELLEEALELDPRNYELAHLLAEVAFRDGDFATAEQRFVGVLQEQPDRPSARLYHGILLHLRGDAAGAAESLQRVTELVPEDFLAHFALGVALAEKGDHRRALASFECAVHLQPTALAWYQVGLCNYELGQIREAARALEQAVEVEPGLESGHHLLGLCYLERRWHRKALQCFQEAQDLSPRSMRYEDLVAYLSGQEEAALPAVGEEADQSSRQAERQLLEGRTRDALRHYGEALRHEPDNPTILMSYALACLQLNKSGEIQTVAQRVLELNPGEKLRATACAALIAALRSEGRLHEGNRIGRHLLEEGSSPYSRAIAYYEIAYNMAELDEDLDEALDLARRSLECAPDELLQFPLAALGWVHYKRREFSSAVDFLRQSAELRPNAVTMMHLGMALLASGDREEAKLIFEDARRIGPRDGSLEETMMELMRDSSRQLERAREKSR